MRRLAIISLALLAAAGAATAQTSPPPASIGERIEQGIEAAEGQQVESPAPLSFPGLDAEQSDASLSAAAGPRRFRTTLDPLDIEQRIDKGLTAAGEETAFPPDYAFGAFQRGWFLTAFSLAIDRAEAGDATAQTLLGVLLSRGLGVKQDLAAAADWYGLAAKAGDREALYALGQLYLDGEGVTQDFEKAAKLFREAADKNHAVAARELGYLLLAGKGVEKNAMLGAAYLRRAATLGDMDAQYTLAGLYVEGVGVVADDGLAARWFGEAARNGHVGAEVEYAIMLFNGRGVPKDEAAAAAWLERAAEADNPVAQLRLARILVDGGGPDGDTAAAARWYLIAKDRGLEDEFMENWIDGLDSEVVEAAREAANTWARSRYGLPALAASDAGAAVDNQVE